MLPREVPGLFKAYGKVVQVASGGDHTLALTEKGVVIAWGDAEQGQVRCFVSITGLCDSTCSSIMLNFLFVCVLLLACLGPQVARKVPSRHKQQGLRLHPVSFPKGVKVKSIFAGGMGLSSGYNLHLLFLSAFEGLSSTTSAIWHLNLQVSARLLSLKVARYDFRM